LEVVATFQGMLPPIPYISSCSLATAGALSERAAFPWSGNILPSYRININPNMLLTY
jgi:hypothetical protein